jgi:UDP-N-acetylmuramoyl-tripeptide--D-alanyl-D-alanine ligase
VYEGAVAEAGSRSLPPDEGGFEVVADNDEAVTWLRAHLHPGDVVLVKASRGARLDLVADALLSDREPGR